MKKFFAMMAVLALCAVTTFAQYTNTFAEATVTVNVARNADVVWDSWVGPGDLGAGGGWLVQGQTKTFQYATFKVTGEASADIDVKYTISSSSANVTVSLISEDVADNSLFTINSAPLVNAAFSPRTFPGAAPGLAEQWLRGKCSVTGVTPGTPASSSDITFRVDITGYSM